MRTLANIEKEESNKQEALAQIGNREKTFVKSGT
jgi:hypothetical protein